MTKPNLKAVKDDEEIASSDLIIIEKPKRLCDQSMHEITDRRGYVKPTVTPPHFPDKLIDFKQESWVKKALNFYQKKG